MEPRPLSSAMCTSNSRAYHGAGVGSLNATDSTRGLLPAADWGMTERRLRRCCSGGRIGSYFALLGSETGSGPGFGDEEDMVREARARERARGFTRREPSRDTDGDGSVPEVGAALSAAGSDEGGDGREFHLASSGEGLHPNRILARPGSDGGLAGDRRRSDTRAGESGEHHGRHLALDGVTRTARMRAPRRERRSM